MATKTESAIALTAHLLRRAGFGASHDELERYAAKGYEETVEELLHPESQLALDEYLMFRLRPQWMDKPHLYVNGTYWVYRMINTRRPLEEKIALFWHGIHCTGYAKVNSNRQLNPTIDLFRQYGLGRFRDLLMQLAKNPTMIYYLDNDKNQKENVNENWGRELLELFAMGVGNYTEQDVKEAARAFTGWTNASPIPPLPYGQPPWEFFYDVTDHDDGEKTFLNHRGRFNGEDIIEIICQQPATARFMARHLYNFFVADEVQVPQWPHTAPRDPEAIETLADAYYKYDYDIHSILRVLFNSDFFKNARFSRIKSPAELVAGTIRMAKAFTTPESDLIDLAMACGYMGQVLLNPPSVEGWHTGTDWVDCGALVERVNFASRHLGDANNPGVWEIIQRLGAKGERLTPEDFVDRCLEQLGCLKAGGETLGGLLEYARSLGEIETGTEEFTLRAVQMLRLISASGDYQLG